MVNMVLESVNMRQQICKLTIIKRFDLINAVEIEKTVISIAHPIPSITEKKTLAIDLQSFIDGSYQSN